MQQENGTVLLVDDEPLIRKAGKRLLMRLGYDVVIAEDGEQALEVYREQIDEIGIVVLDMIMPRMDGAQALAALKELNPDVRVILSSGYAKEDMTPEQADLGASGFLQKPFDSSMLIAELDRVKVLN